jgi:hypothetical protein
VRDLVRGYGKSSSRDVLISTSVSLCKIDRALAAIIVDDALRR